jgi:hypothetical protein
MESIDGEDEKRRTQKLCFVIKPNGRSSESRKARAEQTIEMNHTWANGYSSDKNALLTYMQRYPEAFDTYKKG